MLLAHCSSGAAIKTPSPGESSQRSDFKDADSDRARSHHQETASLQTKVFKARLGHSAVLTPLQGLGDAEAKKIRSQRFA